MNYFGFDCCCCCCCCFSSLLFEIVWNCGELAEFNNANKDFFFSIIGVFARGTSGSRTFKPDEVVGRLTGSLYFIIIVK